MFRIILFLWLGIILFSCRPGNSLLRKNRHEQYAKILKEAGIDQTAMGRLWFQAAETAISQPQEVSLPYQEAGYFAAHKPRAAGLRFAVKQGQKIIISLNKRPASGFSIFTDLFEFTEGSADLCASLDTSGSSLEYEVENEGHLILRIQPSLLESGDYVLSISVAPSLAFPVASKNAHIGSFWGDARDNGQRRHEGIDIFAPRGSPVVAAAGGRIGRVTENRLGGKVIFLRLKNRNVNLYYAHLDSQLVADGERIKAGDTIGLVGNTGNARTTPAHLHFGIYTRKGAIDPSPFVDPVIKKPSPVIVNPEIMRNGIRLTRQLLLRSLAGDQARYYEAMTPAWPVSKSADEYLVEMPDGMITTLKQSWVAPLKPIRAGKLAGETRVFESPDLTAPRIKTLVINDKAEILAGFKEFYYISDGEIKGWIPVSRVR